MRALPEVWPTVEVSFIKPKQAHPQGTWICVSFRRKMVQRHKSISGRGSLPGAGGEAAAAAAAAAATAASAVAYTQISSKLEGIEGLISALKVHTRPGCVLHTVAGLIGCRGS